MTCKQVLLNPFIVRVTLRFRVQASQQCVRDEHTQRRYNRSLVDRESRWSAHRWPSELNADCAIAMRYRRSASSFPSPCSLLPRYSKLGTFSSGGSLPMTTLSRHCSEHEVDKIQIYFEQVRHVKSIAKCSLVFTSGCDIRKRLWPVGQSATLPPPAPVNGEHSVPGA